MSAKLPLIQAMPGRLSRAGWVPPKNLSKAEWIEIGKKLRRCEEAVQWWLGDWWAYGVERDYGDGEELAAAVGVDYGAIRVYGSVSRAYKLLIRINNLDFKHHQIAMAALPDERLKWLRLAAKERWSTGELKAAIAQAHAKERTREVELDAAKLGKFPLIYADPPWRYENPPMGGTNRSIENHFPTMELDEICALDVLHIANDDSLLFLWATAPKLAECMDVINAWGFTYRTNAVWDKEVIGMGYHFRNQHELLLVGKRGELPPPQPTDRPPSIYCERRGEHSAKPDHYLDMIDAMYPQLTKLELFARPDGDGIMPVREGWTFWGNEIGESAHVMEAAE